MTTATHAVGISRLTRARRLLVRIVGSVILFLIGFLGAHVIRSIVDALT